MVYNIYQPLPDESAKAAVICDVCGKVSEIISIFKPDPVEKLFKKILPQHLEPKGWVVGESNHICPKCKLKRFQ